METSRRKHGSEHVTSILAIYFICVLRKGNNSKNKLNYIILKVFSKGGKNPPTK